MTWIIHRGDAYYPSVDEYPTEDEAMEEWRKLKRIRKDGCNAEYVDTDYIALVIESNRVGGAEND